MKEVCVCVCVCLEFMRFKNLEWKTWWAWSQSESAILLYNFYSMNIKMYVSQMSIQSVRNLHLTQDSRLKSCSLKRFVQFHLIQIDFQTIY